MKSWMSRAVVPLSLAVGAGMLAGCGGVSDLTRERVARSETSVQQAQQTIGNSEQGAVELQRAKQSLEQARRALKDSKEQEATRYAQLAQLDAELAVSKSQSASARKAANELLASIKTLRQETERSSGAPTDSGRPTDDRTTDEH
jgi:bacterioferritin-associated ferredoxin